MKAHRLFPIAALFVWATLAYVAGCKYDVTEPLWSQPYTAPATPQITSIDPPSEARPGVSVISIHGHNFIVRVADTSVSSTTVVKFGSTQADIISMDTNLISVWRPNLGGDSIMIRVAPHNAIAEAAYGPYKLYPVIAQYGGFLQNIPLGAIAIDNSENLYVVGTANKSVYKATSIIDNIVIGGGSATTAQTPTCARIGPDGNLYVVENNRAIDKVNLTAGTVARWTQLPSGKVVKFGDFGPTGYFYVGGSRTDLCIIPPNPPVSLPLAQMKLAGYYMTDEILAIRTFNGYVYVASRTFGTQNPTKIWKHFISADSVGARQPVLDMGATAFAADSLSDIAFSSAGTMLIASASATHPLLIVDPATSEVDYFYKGIVPKYCDAFTWSKTSNYLYLISGNTTAGQTWTVYRLDMGTTGAR